MRLRVTPRLVLAGAAAAVVLGIGVFAVVYLTMFNPKPVARVSLPTVSATALGATPVAGSATNLSITTGSFVGYRVREQLANLPAPSDAVGRTSAVTGSAKVTINPDGSATLSDVQVKADLSQLQSDASRRDNYVRNNSLETARYPTASFASDSTVTIPASIVGGSKGDVTISGKFTIHGETTQVSIPLQVQRSGATVNVVGTYGFKWGDYGVHQPSVPVASVQGNPVIELSLVLKSSGA